MGILARAGRYVENRLFRRNKPLPQAAAAKQGIQVSTYRTNGAVPLSVSLSPLACSIGIQMIAFPQSTFTFQNVRGVVCPPFAIARTELTNGQFKSLLTQWPKEMESIVRRPQIRLAWSIGRAQKPDEIWNCPMVGLNYAEAIEVALLLSLRLPTELEWERAAAGRAGRTYPFGEYYDKRVANFNSCGTRSVYAYQASGTPAGVLDLSGNVWEWTSSNYFELDLNSPPRAVINLSRRLKELPFKVIRGGSWNSTSLDNLEADHRGNTPHDLEGKPDLGVRFAADL